MSKVSIDSGCYSGRSICSGPPLHYILAYRTLASKDECMCTLPREAPRDRRSPRVHFPAVASAVSIAQRRFFGSQYQACQGQYTRDRCQETMKRPRALEALHACLTTTSAEEFSVSSTAKLYSKRLRSKSIGTSLVQFLWMLRAGHWPSYCCAL